MARGGDAPPAAAAGGVDPRTEIEGLLAYEERRAGTDAERRAAFHVARRIEALGRSAEIEPTEVRPRWALTHAMHAALAVVGSVASTGSPPLGAGLVLIAALSAYGDLTGRFPLLRLLTARRASQNVVSEEGGEKPGVLVLLAHHDAPQTAGIFRPRSVERRARLAARLRFPLGLAQAFWVSLVALLVCCLVRLLEPYSTPLNLVQLAFTVLLIVAVPLLLDISFGKVVPGANDNASGVATALRLLERFGGRLAHFDLWLVSCGAEEAQALGMRAWVRRHRRELDRERTLFLEIDKVGAGSVHYARREGLIFRQGYDSRLLALCDEVAREGEPPARPYVAQGTGDAAAARSRGLRAISISCLDELGQTPRYHSPGDSLEGLDDKTLEDAYVFCSHLIERIDTQLGPEL